MSVTAKSNIYAPFLNIHTPIFNFLHSCQPMADYILVRLSGFNFSFGQSVDGS